ncbi:hypothetical protein [Aerosakkonema funiforme]|uniref:hypothetical protein n=1 Tax=Aerosakkonema funiforme TaxID=1246630 RepID=UPI0035BB4E72
MVTHIAPRKRKNRSHRFHPIFIATCITVIFFAVNALADQPIYYPNGQVTWRGNIGDTVFHENGQVAWRGSPQTNNIVFHSNGQVAWRGALGNDVFYDNGQVAWRGDRGDSCYRPDGSVLRRNCQSTNWINLGSGISLRVTLKTAQLKLRIPRAGESRSYYTKTFELVE